MLDVIITHVSMFSPCIFAFESGIGIVNLCIQYVPKRTHPCLVLTLCISKCSAETMVRHLISWGAWENNVHTITKCWIFLSDCCYLTFLNSKQDSLCAFMICSIREHFWNLYFVMYYYVRTWKNYGWLYNKL